MKKSLLALLVLFAAVVTVTATASAQSGAATPDTTLSATIRVGSWESGSNLQYWTGAISDFNKVYPKVNVVLEAVPNNYGDVLTAELAAGNAPDVFMTGDGDVAKWQALGAASDLAPYISGKSGFDPAILYPGVYAFGKTGGSVYALTKDYSPLVMYYNADQLKAAGLDAPKAGWTWADILKYAQKLTVDANGNDATSDKFDPKHIKRWGLQIPDSWGAPVWDRGIEPLVYQNGGALLSPDGKKATGFMNSEATIGALQWFVDLFTKYHVAPTATDVAAYPGTDMFQSGLVSMMWTGVWPLDGYTKVKGFNFGTAQLPAGPKASANVLCWSGFMLYSGSKNKDAAWAFLKFIAAGDGAKQFANYGLTPVQSIAVAQGLTKDPLKGSVMADLANLQPIPDQLTQYWGACGNKFFDQEFQTVFDNGTSIKDAMNKAAAETDSCLASQK